MSEVQVVGDGIAGLLVARELKRLGLSVRVWGDRGAHDAPAALVHRHAGRSFRTDPIEDASWTDATAFLNEFVERGFVRRTVMLRPADDERLSRSREAAPNPDAIEEITHPHFGPVFRYGPAYAVDASHLLATLVGELSGDGARFEHRRATPNELSGPTVLACGASLPAHLPGPDLRLYGGQLVRFEGELDCVVSGRGFHAVPLGDDQIVIGSTWWDPGEAMPDDRAAEKLRNAAVTGGIEVGAYVGAWRGLRCVHQTDRRPLLGRLSGDRWVCGALGTRGWFWAPHLARLLGEAMTTVRTVPPSLAPDRCSTGTRHGPR